MRRALKKQFHGSAGRKSGQAIIFLMMVMVIGLFAVLWNIDLHNIISTKMRIDNAGDAGALAAAHWQGVTLNMIGELNLIQVAYVCEAFSQAFPYEPVETQLRAEVQQIADLRSRLALNGPLMGYVAAQSAAFLNLNEKDELNREDGFAAYVRSRGAEFSTCGAFYRGVVEEPYSGAWAEYGALLESIGNNKMVVECRNAEYFQFYSSMSHFLLRPGFYQAVAGGTWCWFRSGQNRDLIDSYQSYSDWDPLPGLAQRTSVNAEFFGVDLSVKDDLLITVPATNRVQYLPPYLEDALAESANAVDTDMLPYTLSRFSFPWHTYRSSWNGTWPTSDDFPFEEGWHVKDEYNYKGADAAVYCYINAVNITPNMRMDSDWIYWQASAKPFGYLDDPDGSGERKVPNYFSFVLPAFHDARLIHNNLGSASGAVDQPGWDEHMYEHLPIYLEGGPDAISGFDDCFYCKQLLLWEDPSLRATGSEWLDQNEEQCDQDIQYYNTGGSNMGRG